MPKKKKRYRITEHVSDSPRAGLKRALDGFNWKLTLQLTLSLVVFFTVFEVGISFEFRPIYPIYYALLIISGAAFLHFNRGVSRKLPDASELPAEWSDERRDKYLARLARDKKVARKLLLAVIPLMLVFAFDVLYLFWFDVWFS